MPGEELGPAAEVQVVVVVLLVVELLLLELLVVIFVLLLLLVVVVVVVVEEEEEEEEEHPSLEESEVASTVLPLGVVWNPPPHPKLYLMIWPPLALFWRSAGTFVVYRGTRVLFSSWQNLRLLLDTALSLDP